MTPAPPTVRLAVPADAEPLGRCHCACWQEAYADLVDPERLAPLVADVAGRVERWRRILATSEGPLVAEHDGEIVGFASAGRNRDEDLDVALELYALYVRRAWWGTGLGHRLLTTALDGAAASLWVFRDNPRARRCYARHGFVPDGREEQEPTFGRPEVRMRRPPQGLERSALKNSLS